MPRTARRRLALALLTLLAPGAGRGVEIESLLLPDAPTPHAAPQAIHLAEAAGMEPLATLQPLEVGAADELAALAAWNLAGRVPARNGVARPLPLPRQVRLGAELAARLAAKGGALPHAGGAALRAPGGALVWSAGLRVEGAWRLRLRLSDVRLPPGTRLWILSGGGGEEVAFRVEDVLRDGTLWTPSVAGPAATLEVELPAGLPDAGFTIDRALELVPLDARGAPLTGEAAFAATLAAAITAPTCLRDASCPDMSVLPEMAVLRKATARLQFVLDRDGHSYVCSGGLLNDTDETTTVPYLLTAHHCIPDDATARSVEAFFDYAATSCDGPAPELATLPRVSGATLLTTGYTSDFSLLHLAALPPGRGLLGSTSELQFGATLLHRVSHPLGLPQRHSQSRLTTNLSVCGGVPPDRFLYSQRVTGGVFPGSSGSPVLRQADGKVVGQLFGACGPTAVSGDGCDSANAIVDGRLSSSWPSLAPWLAPPRPGICVPSPGTLCLGRDERFAVQAHYDAGSVSGQARAVELTQDTGYLWFFDAANVETVIKVLDGCAVNNRFWVYAGGLTNVSVNITVTDTVTRKVKSYTNPSGRAFQPVQDTDAFACK